MGLGQCQKKFFFSWTPNNLFLAFNIPSSIRKKSYSDHRTRFDNFTSSCTWRTLFLTDSLCVFSIFVLFYDILLLLFVFYLSKTLLSGSSSSTSSWLSWQKTINHDVRYGHLSVRFIHCAKVFHLKDVLLARRRRAVYERENPCEPLQTSSLEDHIQEMSHSVLDIITRCATYEGWLESFMLVLLPQTQWILIIQACVFSFLLP